MPNPARLIVGLGNPGDEYAATRHNVGFLVADALAEKYGAGAWKKKFQGLLAPASVADADILLLKPQTFMNLSGESVGEALRFYKLAQKDVIVFHDDLDLEPGQVKIKLGGGTGGHNGLKSLDAHIGPDYWRVRIGIGHPGVKGDAVTNYVLEPFAKSDRAWVVPLLEKMADEFPLLLKGKTGDYQSCTSRKPEGA